MPTYMSSHTLCLLVSKNVTCTTTPRSEQTNKNPIPDWPPFVLLLVFRGYNSAAVLLQSVQLCDIPPRTLLLQEEVTCWWRFGKTRFPAGLHLVREHWRVLYKMEQTHFTGRNKKVDCPGTLELFKIHFETLLAVLFIEMLNIHPQLRP